MPIDDRSSRTGDASSSHSGIGSEDLRETAERLERASWDRMQDESARYGGETPGDDADGAGAILSFLEGQLQERPLTTLLAAVAAGWLVGKLLR